MSLYILSAGLGNNAAWKMFVARDLTEPASPPLRSHTDKRHATEVNVVVHVLSCIPGLERLNSMRIVSTKTRTKANVHSAKRGNTALWAWEMERQGLGTF